MNKMLDLSFKGARTYIQGGDIFNSLSVVAKELCGDTEAFVTKITFRHFAKTACEVTTTQPEPSAQIIGEVTYCLPTNGKKIDGWLIETGIPVTQRRPFDEAALLANAHLDMDVRVNRLAAPTDYTPIEDVIALTKQLNYQIDPDVEGQWVFGQLELSEALPTTYDTLEVQAKSVIKKRFSVNEVRVNGKVVGFMRFIVGAP